MGFEQDNKSINMNAILPRNNGIKKLLETIWNFIYFKTIVGDLCEKIPAIISYIPIIWKARDWDESGIWIVLEHKLKRHRACISKGYHTEDFKISEFIGKVEKACKRLHENDYIKEDWDKYHKKYPTNFDKMFYPRTKKDIKQGVHRMRTAKGKKLTELMRLFELEEETRNKDLKFVSDALRKKSREWWC